MVQGGKWSWSDAEVHAILQACTGSQAVRDRAWFAPGVIWGYRISELMSLKVKDVYDVDAGAIRDFITVVMRNYAVRLLHHAARRPGTIRLTPWLRGLAPRR